MGQYIVRRAAMLLVVVFGASIFVFLMLHLVPGDPAALIAGPEATLEDLEQIREKFGLNRPLPVQYASFVWNALQGDLGNSFRSGRPVTEEVLPRYVNTLYLAAGSMVVAIFLGVSAGVVSSVWRHSVFDHFFMLLALLGLSMPSFWWGLLLLLVFSVNLGWLPMGGMGGLSHLILPSITLGTATAAVIARMTRSTMLEVLNQDFIRTARAKGLPEARIVLRHALRNALIPTVTITGIQFGVLLGGQVVTETIFSWPGLGRLLVDSIGRRDLPIVQGAILLLSMTFALINLLVDVGYGLLDPRVRYD